MKISTRKLKFMKLNFMVILLMMSISFTALGQTIPTPGTTDYVSFQSGPWDDVNTWRVNGAIPTSKPSTGTSFGHNVFISNGHVISVNAAESCRNLYINSGGSLINGNTTNNTLSLGRSLADGATQSVLINNGTIGSGNGVDVATINSDRLDLRILNTYGSGFPETSTFTFSGTGNTKIMSLTAQGAGTGNKKTMTINLNHDASRTLVIVGASTNRVLTLNRFDGVNATTGQSINENYIMNINAPVALSAGAFQFNSSGGTALVGGTYTYNVNSTLDASRTTATQGFIPLPQPSANYINTATNAENITTLNVSGTYIMGSGGYTTVNSQNNGTSGVPVSLFYSRVSVNILNGGLVDATKIVDVNFGLSNNLQNSISGAFFNISGTGKLRRNLPSSSTNNYFFPIGTATGYSPIFIRNTGTTGDFTVGVINNFTDFSNFTAPVTNNFTLKSRFTIEASNSASVIGLLRFGWLANNEGTNFVRTSAVSLQKYNTANSIWEVDGNATPTTVSGTGTGPVSQNTTATLTPAVADPFVVTLTGTIALTANYTISQAISVLPLNLLSFTGKLNEFNKQVELKWITTSEVNTKNFEVQESTDGKNFNVVGIVAAKNTSGIHNYSFTVNTNKSGVLYYKLRQVDLDGQFQFSDVIAVEKNGSLLTVYPNPAEDNLTVTIPEGNTAASIAIYALDGKMVYSKSVSANELISNINISTLNTGIYTLVLNKGKESLSQKFIKK